MAKTITLPDFRLEADGYHISVHFEDATYRYHFWINRRTYERQDDILHANLIVPPTEYGKTGHRPLDQTAKKWWPIISGIMAKINNEGLIAKAIIDNETKLANEAAEREAAYNKRALDNLRIAANLHLPENAAKIIETTPEFMRLAFVTSILNLR